MTSTMLSLDQALERIFAMTEDFGAQTVPVAEAAGRVSAEPVIARITQPPFNASAMDGYAMAAADAKAGAVLKMIGTSQAGSGFDGVVKSGQCLRIFTGAPLPAGADTVVMQENTTIEGTDITFTTGAAKGNNVRRAGQDFAKGDVLIEAGIRLNPVHIALAAAGNNASIAVARRPKIAVVASGDELVPPGSSVAEDQIVSSNSTALASLLKPHAETVTDLGIAPDDEAKLREMLKAALDGSFDVLITSGGASVGDHDIVQPVLKSLGVAIDFWKIAMRPGKPLMAGKLDKTLVFGLPGNPVSSMVTAQVAVVPALRHMTGDINPLGQSLILPLASALPANGPRRHFIRASLVNGPLGTSVDPSAQSDSAHLSSLAGSDVLIIHPESAEAMPAGTMVSCLPLAQ